MRSSFKINLHALVARKFTPFVNKDLKNDIACSKCISQILSVRKQSSFNNCVLKYFQFFDINTGKVKTTL